MFALSEIPRHVSTGATHKQHYKGNVCAFVYGSEGYEKVMRRRLVKKVVRAFLFATTSFAPLSSIEQSLFDELPSISVWQSRVLSLES
jgi:hypothetical protein